MKLYNSYSLQLEELKPIEPGKVSMYVCGPTVYNYPHIGNARPIAVFDTLKKALSAQGLDVTFVSNYTDVDDKIIKKAIEEGVSAEEISTRYIKECKKDMEGMNIQPATKNPLATEEIGAKSLAMSDRLQLLTIVDFTLIWRPVAAIFAAAGILIGVGGSLTAIRKFLHV